MALNRASSAVSRASVRTRARQSVRKAKNPITMPAGTNFVPSHGSVPSRMKQSAASRRVIPSSSRSAKNAAPASAVAATSSG